LLRVWGDLEYVSNIILMNGINTAHVCKIAYVLECKDVREAIIPQKMNHCKREDKD